MRDMAPPQEELSSLKCHSLILRPLFLKSAIVIFRQQFIPIILCCLPGRGGGALGYFLGGYVPPGTPNWHPVLKKISSKIDTLF